ncbi:MAG: SGNH/GDSL hydrolase family protein [Clostridia bacterium]|nr:SGNH/GDSL hydrolase family protein [Clostridia bacterium]MBQ9795325.1 SGNH/GDSL hydrolase family protein [Clostridia bacterium]
MKLEGKSIAFLGDSITEGYGVSDRANNRYDNRLKRMCGLKAVYNYGIGGTRLAHQSTPSDNPRHDLCFCGRAYNITKEADVILVYGGVNDYLHGDAPIGQYGDKTPATFWGGVYFLMSFLRKTYSDKTLVFLAPAHCQRKTYSDLEPSDAPSKREDAMPLLNYVQIIQRQAQDFGIPVLSLYDSLGLDPKDPEIYRTYTVDGLHFNDEGHGVLANCIRDFLEALPEA